MVIVRHPFARLVSAYESKVRVASFSTYYYKLRALHSLFPQMVAMGYKQWNGVRLSIIHKYGETEEERKDDDRYPT